MEEVSLREYIEVLLKWKWFVALVTVVAVVTSGIFSFFVLPPVYEAKATLQVNMPPAVTPPQGNTPLEALLQSLATSQQASMETYRYQVTNPVLLQRVQEKLNLGSQKYSLQALQKAIKVDNPKNTNLLEISISDTDPRLAQNLANTLAGEYVAFLKELHAGRLGQSSSAIEAQIKQEEEKLNAATEEYRQFLAQPRGVKELEAEQQAKVELLTSFKSDLLKTQVQLQGARQGLKAAEAKLVDTPEVLKTTKALGEEPLLQDIAQEKSGQPAEKVAGLALKSEEPNPIYIALATDANRYRMHIAELEENIAALKQAIAATEKEMQSLQAELAQKKIVDERYQARISSLKNNYQALLDRGEDTRIAGSLDTSMQTRLVAPAVEPQVPVKPRKMLNLAVAGVLGIMVGIFLAFFLEFWRSTGPESKTVPARG